MARLSTHVLDLVRGMPAQGVTIDLHRVEETGRRHIQRDATNTDGRTLFGDRLEPGVYELTFFAGGYFPTPFFNDVVVRFSISEPEGNYHVPLLLSPYGYTTYRGS